MTSDDPAIANQISAILVQLRQECPSSNVMRLDVAAATLETFAADARKAAGVGATRPESIVLIVLSPDPEKALSVGRDIRRRTTARILAVGPATDPKLVLRAMREGVSEYLDQGDLQTELSEALERLEAAGTSGRIIALLAPCGGSGASTLAVNIATVLAQKHTRCAMIDMKLEAGDLAPLLDLKPNHTLSDLCQNIERLDHSLLQGCLARCDSGVQLLAAPKRIGDVASVTPAAIGMVLSLICRHFPFVVADLDHNYRAEQSCVLLQADVIVCVIRLDFISLRNARTTLDFFQELGVQRNRVRIVVNRFGEPNQLTLIQAEESLGIKIFKSIPEEPKTVNRANNNGIPFVLQAPSAKVSRSVTELANSLAEPVKVSGR